MRWLSPTWNVARQQREAVGRTASDTRGRWLYASEFRDGRLVSMCEFELDDEEAAFAYAEERSKESPQAP